jgi:hypothetical protein
MREIWFALGVGAVCLASAAACGSDDAPGSGPNGSDAGADAPPLYTGGACPDVGLGGSPAALHNVRAQANGGTVRVDYDLFDGAKDYRVYALPAKGATAADGTNPTAVYRCAGNRQVPDAIPDDGKLPDSYAVHTRVASNVLGFARTLEGATLGHVYTTPGAGRIPVYALGDSDKDADNSCFFQRWTESRVKTYTTSEDERRALLAKRFRDDGIAFYAVAPGSPDSVVIGAADGEKAKLYVAEGTPEAAARKGTPAFTVRTKPDGDTLPLMRVFYDNDCGTSHDELVAGKGKFERAYHQGPLQPHDVLHWSGVTGPTTLVVEALDDLCPFQGILSPTSRPAHTEEGISYPPFLTPDEIRAASPTHELFVGGQGDGTKPKVVARACVEVKPRELDALDFTFPAAGETFSAPQESDFQTWRFDSPSFDVHHLNAATDEWAIGSMFGELWTPHADWSGDTNGKLRMTAKTKASIAADKFVKVRMQVDATSTDRRYPQMLVSEVAAPLQDNMKTGTTILVQTIETGVTKLQDQICDHREWDVNNQCPGWDLYNLDSGGTKFLAPNVEVASQTGFDRTSFFEIWVSTQRVYVMLDNQPYGCVNLPAGRLPAGPGTVTFGDVLYHSTADLQPWQPFYMSRYHVATTRHFSNMGFGNGRDAPPWDENRLPCVSGAPQDNN